MTLGEGKAETEEIAKAQPSVAAVKRVLARQNSSESSIPEVCDIYIYIYIHVCMYIYIHIYVYIYTLCIYMHVGVLARQNSSESSIPEV